jgi:tRNA pseudouridine38-40 synthase
MRYFIHLSYNGTNFCGWQIQPNEPSVQETIEKALFYILKEKINITGCGRTDTGVHALSYCAHFDFKEMTNEELEKLTYRLNAFFSYDIRIISIKKVKDDAHARFDAISRTYKYYIATQKQPFNNDFTYYLPRPLNIEKMNLACKKLLAYTDFTSFSKLHTQVNNNNCTINFASWEKKGDLLVFTINANRFLRNMVRSIVGTMIEVGLEKINVEEFCKIIEEKDRASAGVSVAAKALFLFDVVYEKGIFLDF